MNDNINDINDIINGINDVSYIIEQSCHKPDNLENLLDLSFCWYIYFSSQVKVNCINKQSY